MLTPLRITGGLRCGPGGFAGSGVPLCHCQNFQLNWRIAYISLLDPGNDQPPHETVVAYQVDEDREAACRDPWSSIHRGKRRSVLTCAFEAKAITLSILMSR